ncbi:radical SAM protein [Chloroflexota bacterium]
MNVLKKYKHIPKGKKIGMQTNYSTDHNEKFDFLTDLYFTASTHSWFNLGQEIYAFRAPGGFVIYAPLKQIAAIVDPRTFSEFALATKEKDNSANSGYRLLQFISTKQSLQIKKTSSSETDFMPTEAILSPTSGCTLKCEYCYANGGDKPYDMDPAIAILAIDFVIDNARKLGVDYIGIGFHGQGEPTHNWKLFRSFVEYTESECRKFGIIPSFGLATNGILDSDQVSYLVGKNFKLSVSLDGTKEVMDTLRPARNGGSSFDAVLRTIRQIDSESGNYGIRTTVTPNTVGRMTEFVEFLSSETECKYVVLEQMFRAGRAANQQFDPKEFSKAFIEGYLAAFSLGKQLGIVVDTGAKVEGLRLSFCKAHGNDLNFYIRNDGRVLSCYEVAANNHQYFDEFCYGQIDPKQQKISFDQKKIVSLFRMGYPSNLDCADCFAKWNCAGGCFLRTKRDQIEYCNLHRTILIDSILKKASSTMEMLLGFENDHVNGSYDISANDFPDSASLKKQQPRRGSVIIELEGIQEPMACGCVNKTRSWYGLY